MNADVRFDVEFTEETSTFEADVGEVFFSGGEDVVLQSKSVTPTEAIQEVTADEGYAALEKVTVAPIPDEYIVPSGDLAITENGTFDVAQYASAEVNVEPILEEITITENGEYTPSGDGYSKVTVEVESGGVSDDRVHYVTFMYGDTELYRMPVVNGDTCHNPVAKGYIETPTKESTVQYEYSYSGWSLTEGGAASSTALTNVTEDRTVYVAFAETVRKYTVTYYDSDGVTVLKTESLAYGATPSYLPEKSGYSFDSWNPASPVTGDMNYTAVWIEAVIFASGSWEDIIEIAKAYEGEKHFKVGDTRTETLTYADGSTEIITLTVADFNKDGNEQITANMTLVSNVLINNKKIGVSGSVKRFEGSTLDRWLYGDLFNALPSNLSNNLIRMILTQKTSSNSSYEAMPRPVAILSKDEVFSPENGHALFINDTENSKGYKTGSETAVDYWTRDWSSGSNFAYVAANGYINYGSESLYKGVRFKIAI